MKRTGDSGHRNRVLVEPGWVLDRLDDDRVVLLEVDEQPLLYRLGHAPGARSVNWRDELQDPVTRDLPDAEAIAALWSRCGIGEDTTVVLYGDKNNWYACFAYWLFSLYGLGDLRILDGGRPLWVASGLPLSTEEPAARAAQAPEPRFEGSRRALWWDLCGHAEDLALVDVRSPEEYRGERLTEPGYPDEVAQRPGHVPGAVSIPWALATGPDGRFRSDDELRRLYADHGVPPNRPVVTYCRVGERSAHTWFVLHELLGYPNVRNYDGSWTEWGSMVGMPVALGAEPGALPRTAAGPVPVGFTRTRAVRRSGRDRREVRPGLTSG